MSFFDYPEGGERDEPKRRAFLADVPDDEWDLLRAHCEMLKLAPGQVATPEGVVDRALYIVVDGELEVLGHRSRRGGERQLGLIPAGTVFGEIAFFDGLPRSATVRATADTTLLRLSYESFTTLAAKDPALSQRVLMDIGDTLATRLRALDAQLAGGRR